MGVWGFRVSPPTLDRLVYLYLHKWGLMGAGERRFFETHLRPGMKVVDVGANLGLYSLLFSRLVGPSGRVFSFEPDPELFASFEANCRRQEAANLARFEVALGAREGSAQLCRSLIHSGDNRLDRRHPPALCRTFGVRVARLAEMLPGERIDFVKIDVQGRERQVLEGMREILAGDAPLKILLEFSPRLLREAGSDPLELLEYLRSFSLRLSLPEGGALRPLGGPRDLVRRLGRYGYTNLFAVR